MVFRGRGLSAPPPAGHSSELQLHLTALQPPHYYVSGLRKSLKVQHSWNYLLHEEEEEFNSL